MRFPQFQTGGFYLVRDHNGYWVLERQDLFSYQATRYRYGSDQSHTVRSTEAMLTNLQGLGPFFRVRGRPEDAAYGDRLRVAELILNGPGEQVYSVSQGILGAEPSLDI